MKHRLVVLIMVLFLAGGAKPQDRHDTRAYVIVPSETVLLVAAAQPGSPVELLNARLLNPVDGSRRAAFQYLLRNRSEKPIRSVFVHALNSSGTGEGPLYNGHILKSPLLPGHSTAVGEMELPVVNLTTHLRERLKFTDRLRVVVVLLIERVEYMDGSIFEDRTTLRSLDNYFLEINSATINSRADSGGPFDKHH